MKQGVLPSNSTQQKEKMNYKEITKNRLGFDLERCPCCKIGTMKIVLQFRPNTILVSMPNPPPNKNDDPIKMINNAL